MTEPRRARRAYRVRPGGREHRRPPLGYVLTASFGIVALPLLAAGSTLVSFPGSQTWIAAIVVAVALALLGWMVGNAVWAQRQESRRFAFSDLMLWNALRSIRAARRVERKAHLLGFDLSGKFAGHVRVPPEQQLEIARDISFAIEGTSAYSRGHSQRVEKHARRLATEIGLSHEETAQLAIAATLHDIGNIQVPDDVLHKAGELTSEERAAIEGHVLLGSAMAFTAGSTGVMEAVRYHHEWWDGSGYPSGLSGTDIPLFARIIAVAEAFDALISPRPYRHGFSRGQAIAVLQDHAGTQFDPTLVEVFARTLPGGIAALTTAPGAFVTRRVLVSLRTTGGLGLAISGAALAGSMVVATAVVSPTTLEIAPPLEEARRPRPVSRAPIVISAPERTAEGRGARSAPPGRTPDAPVAVDTQVLGERIQRNASRPRRVERPDPRAPASPPDKVDPPVRPGGPGAPARPDEEDRPGERKGHTSHGNGVGRGHDKAHGRGHDPSEADHEGGGRAASGAPEKARNDDEERGKAKPEHKAKPHGNGRHKGKGNGNGRGNGKGRGR